MKPTWERSGITCTMSPDNSTPRPSSPPAQCSTVPPAKCPPQRTRVRPSPSSFVSPSHSSIAGAGRPLDHSRVVVRMRDGDAGEASAPRHLLIGAVVDEVDAVPHHVVYDQRPLPDRKPRVHAHARELAVLAHFVAALRAQLLERRPPLALLRHVLPRVGADRALGGLCLALGELGAAGDADPVRHPASAASRRSTS